MQKKYIESPLTHKKVVNRGELPQTYITNGHQPIIDRDTWNRVQDLIKFRREKYNLNKILEVGQPKTRCKSEWTGFVICPYCYRNYTLTTSRATKRKILIDSANREVLTCMQSQSVYVDVLEKVIIEQIKILYNNIPAFKNALTTEFSKQIDNSLNNEKIELEKGISALQDRLKHLDHSKESSIVLETELKAEIKDLMIQLSILNNKDNTSNLLDQLPNYINIIKQINNIESLSDIPYRELFSKVIAVKRDKLIFVIGNVDKTKIDINAKTLFNGTIKHKERATTYTTEFGIIIHV